MAATIYTLEDVLKASAASAGEARRLADICPEYSSALTRYAQGIEEARETLIRRTRLDAG